MNRFLGPTITDWKYVTDFRADKSTITLTRRPVLPDTRSPRHRMLAELFSDGKALRDVTVSVGAYADDGTEASYRLHYKHTLATGMEANRDKLSEALLAALGTHESGQLWRVDWNPEQPIITLSLRKPLEKMILHSLPTPAAELPTPTLAKHGIGRQQIAWPSRIPNQPGQRLHVPYASCEIGSDVVDAFWNVSHRSSAPHMLVVGPTGGGKTVLLTTVITELVLRGIPVIGVDPKRIELHQFLGYPGVPAIVFEPLRAAKLIYALWCEMHARTKYMQIQRIAPANMPLLVAVLDEFFILSASWTQMAKSGTDLEKDVLKFCNPLGRIGELVALARSTGIRLAVGVQRPDAHLFGRDSGGVRDNFKTRASLARLSSDGAYMMWGDTTVGRDIDAAIAGRATVTDPSGDPALAQVWFTPSVDAHPAVRADMSGEERGAVDSLRPEVDTPVFCFSAELPEFIAEEQALITAMANDVRDPIAISSSFSAPSAADTIADAIPARSIEEGMHIVVGLDDDPDLTGLVTSVEIAREVERTNDGTVTDEGKVIVGIAVESAGRRPEVLFVEYGGLDTVVLAAPELTTVA
ncbi:FtsK/SpoIIIE domain-containing protein [Rhodococcus sp. USK13]|uniref:FtsK/SpoIIIE domain-containing protein n=1 Tax=Rhodococcus sp. USK13 TaxID=2806442 RepID=UPI001BD07F4E|nr:FtsK/SpoIIIE domain-containing protein [Rhodococcus sp. USK13]